MHLQASALLRRNIEALLRARGQTRHDLAMWCRRSDAWLSKIMDINGTRGLPLKYLDRISDFFGIETHQLFLPGISHLHERRKGDRRSGQDRRQLSATVILRDPADDAKELVRLVLSAGAEDRRALYAQLLALRTASPSRATPDAAKGSGRRTTQPTPKRP